MNVEESLDYIEEILDNGTSIPFMSKMAVDVDAIRAQVNNIRLALPVEINKAQEIVGHYNSIIKKASTEASVTTSTAQKQAEEIVNSANEKAKAILENADANAKQEMMAAAEKARKMVEATEVAQLAKEYADRVRSNADEEAKNIVAVAEGQASGIVQDAETKAAAVKKNAEEWSSTIRTATTRFVGDIMKNSDDILSANIAEIRKARQQLQASAEK